jgi:hypothetical protein
MTRYRVSTVSGKGESRESGSREEVCAPRGFRGTVKTPAGELLKKHTRYPTVPLLTAQPQSGPAMSPPERLVEVNVIYMHLPKDQKYASQRVRMMISLYETEQEILERWIAEGRSANRVKEIWVLRDCDPIRHPWQQHAVPRMRDSMRSSIEPQFTGSISEAKECCGCGDSRFI